MPRECHAVRAAVLSPEITRLLGRIPVAFADALPHHADADAVPAHAALDAVTVAGRGVADLHQVAVVVDRVVAVVDVSVAVQVEVARVAGLPGRRTVGELRIVGPCLRLFVALEQPVALVAPHFAEGHPLVIVDRVVGRERASFGRIAGDLAGVVPYGDFNIVAQGLARNLVAVAPRQAGLPPVGAHVGVVTLGGAVAEYGRQLFAHHIHVGCLLAVDVGREVQAAVECLEIQAEVIGRGLFPCQALGNRGGCLRVVEHRTVVQQARLCDRHRGEVGVGIADEAVARRTDRCADLQVVEPVGVFHEVLFRDAPSHRTRGEESPTLVGRELGVAVVTAAGFQ